MSTSFIAGIACRSCPFEMSAHMTPLYRWRLPSTMMLRLALRFVDAAALLPPRKSGTSGGASRADRPWSRADRPWLLLGVCRARLATEEPRFTSLNLYTRCGVNATCAPGNVGESQKE